MKNSLFIFSFEVSVKSFVFKLVLIVGIICSLIYVANKHVVISGYIYRYHSICQFRNIPANLDIINLGSSHSAAFRFSDVKEVTGWNFALPAQTLYYDFEILKQYSSHLQNNAVVLIPVSFFTFLSTPNHDRTLVNRYYLILDNASVIDANPVRAWFVRNVPLLTVKNIFDVFLTAPQSFDKETIVTLTLDNLDSKAVRTRRDWSRMRGNRPEMEFIDSNKKIMQDMLNYCMEKGFRPVMVSTPLHHSMQLAYSADELAFFKSLPKAFAARYPSVPYLDYSFHDSFTTEALLFSDNNHLNPRGELLFTHYLREDLISLGLYPIQVRN